MEVSLACEAENDLEASADADHRVAGSVETSRTTIEVLPSLKTRALKRTTIFEFLLELPKFEFS